MVPPHEPCYRAGMVGSPNPNPRQRARELAHHMLGRTQLRPRIAMLLGTGHASITNQLHEKVLFHADDLPEQLGAGVPLAIGTFEGVAVAVADAPLAPYEGMPVSDLVFPVRLLRALGCDVLVLTAGAASLTRHMEPGSVAILDDHINLSGIHPLHGPNDDQLGPRFPDMSEPYSRRLQAIAQEAAVEAGIPCLPGVFAAVPGPNLPTRAEYRYLRNAGADIVGMSLVPEAVAAVHAGFEVLALAGVTQQVAEGQAQQASLEAMLDAADLAAPRIAALIAGVIHRIPAAP